MAVYLTDPSGNFWSLSVNATGALTWTEGIQPGPSTAGGYPSMETVMNLVRVYLNDWQAGATNTPGEGQITTDTSPQTLPAFNACLRELYRELRNVGAPVLICDNVLVNLPANGATGPGTQTYLGMSGYFDGQTLQPSPTLPVNLLFPLELWEQQTGSSLPFVPMCQPQAGLPSVFNQTFALRYWEWRGGAPFTPGAGGPDALWFCGALCPITIRMRYLAALTQFVSPLTFASTFIPVMDCEDVLAYKIAYKISRSISGMTPPVADLKACAAEALAQLRNEVVRRAQEVEYHRQPFGGHGGGMHRGGDNL
jgi:hypothetical protein